MNKLILSSSPHISEPQDLSKVMRAVFFCLLPAAGMSLYFFRGYAALLIGVCVLTALATEALWQFCRFRKVALSDWSAAVTGLLLALMLPPGLPVWCAVIGTAAALILGKHIFGGLGTNIFNPALIGRAFLMASFPVLLTTWIVPAQDGFSIFSIFSHFDAVTSATPLAEILPKFFPKSGVSYSLINLLTGARAGSLGETSSIALIIGGLILIARGYADWRIPLSYALTVAGFSGIFYILIPGYPSPIFHLLSGGFLLGALFMATDPVTSPVTKSGRWIFGFGAGIIMVVIRLWGGLPEGVMYSILLMNAVTPLINRWTKPRVFGSKG